MDESLFRLHNCDVRDFQKILNSYGHCKEFVDVTVTSPPYYDVKTYGYENQIGYGQQYPKYLNDLGTVFGYIFDVTKETGSLWIVIDTFNRKGSLVPLPFELSEMLEQKGWNLVDIIIWKKDKTLPWSKKGQLRNIFEYVLFFAKSNHYRFYADRIRVPDFSQLEQWWVKFPERYNPKGALPTNVWEYPIPTQGSWSGKSLRHLNPLPPKLVERVLLLTTDEGDVVLDPFAGSGTVLAVADFMNRRWFGFEMRQDYCGMLEKYVLQEIREEMLTEKKRDNELELLRKNFEETIKNLRLVKFPKTFIKELHRTKFLDVEKDPINTVFAMPKERGESESPPMPKHKFIIEDIFLIFDSYTETETLEKQISKVISRPPLSKFGIEPRVFLLNRDEFISEHRNQFEGFIFWLYTFEVMYKFERQITFSQWLLENIKPQWKTYFRDGMPPIMSNVMVNQKIPKTWKSKEERFGILRNKYKELIGID